MVALWFTRVGWLVSLASKNHSSTAMEWYYSKNDVQMGPVSLADLQQKVAHGEVLPSDMAWREGMGDWKPVSALSELRVTSHAAQATQATPAAPYVVPVAKQTSGLAIASLICGVIGLLGPFLCFLPSVLGVGGIVCGHLALGQIKRASDRLNGRGLAIVGLISGYLSIVIVLLCVAFFGFVAVMGNMDSEGTPVEEPVEAMEPIMEPH